MDTETILWILIGVFVLFVICVECKDIEFFDITALLSPTTWTLTTSGQISQIYVSKGSNNTDLWGVNQNGQIFNSPLINAPGGTTPTWTPVPGPSGVTVSKIAANDNIVVVNATNNTCWYFARSSGSIPTSFGSWVQFGGGASSLQLDVNSTQVWSVAPGNNVWYANIPNPINPIANTFSWTSTGAQASNITVNDQYAWLVNPNNSVYSTALSPGSSISGGNFKNISGAVMKQLSLDPVSDTVWGVTPGGAVYWANASTTTNTFTQVTTPATMQSISVHGPYAWATSTSTSGNVYIMETPYGVANPPVFATAPTSATTPTTTPVTTPTTPTTPATTCPVCQNGGSCTSPATTCTCLSGWTGPLCDTQSVNNSTCNTSCVSPASSSGPACTAANTCGPVPVATSTATSTPGTSTTTIILVVVLVVISIMAAFGGIWWYNRSPSTPSYDQQPPFAAYGQQQWQQGY